MTERADHHNDHHHDENVYYDAALNTFAAIGVYHTINSGLKLIKSYAPTNVFMVAEAVINGIETIKNMPPSYMVAAATTIAAVAVTINHACDGACAENHNKQKMVFVETATGFCQGIGEGVLGMAGEGAAQLLEAVG